MNAIKVGRISHAYLFNGPRGVGKTTSARLLAKALNCVDGPTSTPCGECENCTSIAKGNSLDVIEIDGASNTSVENIRQIKDEVLFPPSNAKDKIYIIDEVHMLSTGAFNALPVIDGTDWSDEVHDSVPDTIKMKWSNIIDFVISSDDDTFREQLSNYFDVLSLIDYYLFCYVGCALDQLGKNQMYLTYDGEKWYASVYDSDSTWGLYCTGTPMVSYDYRMPQDYEIGKHGAQNTLYKRLEKIFHNEIKERYIELR